MMPDKTETAPEPVEAKTETAVEPVEAKTETAVEPVEVIELTGAQQHAAWLRKLELERYEAALRRERGDRRRRERQMDACRD